MYQLTQCVPELRQSVQQESGCEVRCLNEWFWSTISNSSCEKSLAQQLRAHPRKVKWGDLNGSGRSKLISAPVKALVNTKYRAPMAFMATQNFYL